MTALSEKKYRAIARYFLYEIREELVQAQYFTTVDTGDIYHSI